jgi:hypothetical protein
MSERLQFSAKRPETMGYYWWQRAPGERPEMLLYYGDDFPNVTLFSRDESMPLQELVDFAPDLRFAGPILEPKD